jgi:hypothetical protein
MTAERGRRPNVGVSDTGTIYGRRTELETSLATYQQTPLRACKSTDVAAIKTVIIARIKTVPSDGCKGPHAVGCSDRSLTKAQRVPLPCQNCPSPCQHAPSSHCCERSVMPRWGGIFALQLLALGTNSVTIIHSQSTRVHNNTD